MPDVTARQILPIKFAIWTKATPDGCWTWQGTLTNKGYGFARRDGRRHPVHRLVYELVNGPIADGLVIDHLCRNRACIKPEHLRAVTLRENTMAAHSLSITAINARKTHCVHGHPLSGDNLIGTPNRRRCKTCLRDRR